jgi:hypothetical protein
VARKSRTAAKSHAFKLRVDILLTMDAFRPRRFKVVAGVKKTRRCVMMLYFDFFIEFLYLRGTESRTGTGIEPPVNKTPV